MYPVSSPLLLPNAIPLCGRSTFQIVKHLSYFYFLYFQTLLFVRLTSSISSPDAQAVFFIQSKSLEMASGVRAACKGIPLGSSCSED